MRITESKMKYKGFEFRQSKNTGGKAGKGNNITTSIHVVNPITYMGKYFSYKTFTVNGYDLAIEKAKKWIDSIS